MGGTRSSVTSPGRGPRFGHPKGPYTESQVKAMLDAAAITLDTRFHRPGMAVWRPLRELFPGTNN